MSHGAWQGGGGRGQFDQQVGPDGRTVADRSLHAPSEAGDLGNFGKLNKTPKTFGPSNIAKRKAISEVGAKKKVYNDLKEFFIVRNLEEAEYYFIDLPAEYHFRLVDKLVTFAIESKVADAQLVGDLFNRAVSKGLCSLASFEEGFLPTAEILDDIAIYVPRAFNLMDIMMKGAGLDKDSKREERIMAKYTDSDKIVALLLS